MGKYTFWIEMEIHSTLLDQTSISLDFKRDVHTCWCERVGTGMVRLSIGMHLVSLCISIYLVGINKVYNVITIICGVLSHGAHLVVQRHCCM